MLLIFLRACAQVGIEGIGTSTLSKASNLARGEQMFPYRKEAQAVQPVDPTVYTPGIKHKIHVRVDDDLHRRLRTHTAEQGITVQQFIEGLIRQALS
jgi:predicted HicB family RNase H-like nuclease